METKIVVTGLLGAGAIMGLWGITTSGSAEPSAPPAAVSELLPTDAEVRDPAGVVSFFEARVEQYPDSFLDRTQLGVALTSQARAEADLDLYAAAEDQLRVALSQNDQHAPALVALGRALHAQHEFVAAQELAARRLADDPGDLAAQALLGDTQLELGDADAALDTFRLLESRERSAPVISRIARTQFALGRPDVAVDLAEEALEASGRHRLSSSDAAFYWFQLGHFRFATGDIDGAIDALEAAREIAPGHPGATEKLAFVLASTGDTAEAEALYRELIDGGAAPDLHGSYAELLAARGADAAAAEQERMGALLAAETIDSYPAERRHLVGFFLTRDPATAVDLARADLDERQDWGAHDTLAWALFHAGDAVAADIAIAPAIATGVRDAALLYHAAEIAAAVGDEGRALTHVTEALAINAQFHPFDGAAAVALHDRLSRR